MANRIVIIGLPKGKILGICEIVADGPFTATGDAVVNIQESCLACRVGKCVMFVLREVGGKVKRVYSPNEPEY